MPLWRVHPERACKQRTQAHTAHKAHSAIAFCVNNLASFLFLHSTRPTMLARLLRPLLLASALLCSSSLVAANIPQAVRSADGSFAVLFGNSGGDGSIKVLKNTTNGAGQTVFQRTFEMRLQSIQEIAASNGRVVQSASRYAADSSNWMGPSATTLNGLSAQLCTYQNTSLNVRRNSGTAASIEIKAYILSVSGFINNGNQSISVPKNALKLTFDIDSWPFESAQNTLQLSLELMLDTRSSQSTETTRNFDNGRQRRLDWGGAALDVVTSAIIDGVLTPIANPVLTQNGGKTFISFSFPSFSHLTYDPTVSVDDQLGAASAGASGLGALAVIVAALAAMLQNKL